MTDDFLASLDAELSVLASRPKLETERKKLMSKLRDNRTSKYEGGVLKAKLSEVDATLEAMIWTPMAAVAFFAEQSCDSCGSSHRMFLQHMEKQSTGKFRPTTRWKRVSRPNPDLPTEVVIQHSVTHICFDCCEDHGFSFPSAELKFISSEAPFTISPTYEQDELYAHAEEV
jgi:hypothetical protein